jgi:transposase
MQLRRVSPFQSSNKFRTVQKTFPQWEEVSIHENSFLFPLFQKKMDSTLTIIRQHIGIDISKDTFMACIGFQKSDLSVQFASTKKFDNTYSGFEKLRVWSNSFAKTELPLSFTMEATGIYYETLAYYLFEHGLSVSVQLAKQVKNYVLSLNVKTKTDESDAKVIAQMGLERKLKSWNPASDAMRGIKLLIREREDLIDENKAIKNQLHALMHGKNPPENIIARLKKRIDFINQQLLEIEKEIKTTTQLDPLLNQKIANVCTIKGVSFITAITIIAETNGFALTTSPRALVSYAGYDVVKNQSGTSLNSKTKISKKGNKRIRKALYFPAVSASQHDPKHKAIYTRIHEKTTIKMKGAVAIQRRLLVLIYTLFKNNVPYDENYQQAKQPSNGSKKIRQIQNVAIEMNENCPA